MIIKSGRCWLRIDPRHTQKPWDLMFLLKLPLKVGYLWIFRDSSGKAFHNCNAAYLHFQCNISQHSWEEHVVLVWPPCCDVLRHVVRCWVLLTRIWKCSKFFMQHLWMLHDVVIWSGSCDNVVPRHVHKFDFQYLTIHAATCRNRETKHTQHVVPNDVVICCRLAGATKSLANNVGICCAEMFW